MPDRMPEDMPDRMPEDMSDRMPEDLPVTKCINVMVGITRSKVINLTHVVFAAPWVFPLCLAWSANWIASTNCLSWSFLLSRGRLRMMGSIRYVYSWQMVQTPEDGNGESLLCWPFQPCHKLLWSNVCTCLPSLPAPISFPAMQIQ